MLLTAVLEDKMFASLTQDSFERVFDAKTGAFEALTHALDIASLDFLITFTSISGMFGSAGQTNYAAYVMILVITGQYLLNITS
jgi:hypothetical protein